MLICASMAFEDRSSPNAATSPHNSIQKSSPNSPESTRTSPYTCTTIQRDNSRGSVQSPPLSSKSDTEKSFFRITSFALSSHSNESIRASPPVCESTNLSIPGTTTAVYQSYRPFTPERDLASPASPNGSIRSYTTSTCSQSPPPRNEPEEPTIQTLKYSIRNILQPDFGKNAVLKTKTVPRIAFKPYENEVCDGKPFGTAPLGSLCQTVSQIGNATRVPELVQRPKSPAKPAVTEETKVEDGKVPTLWPAWVYCTRYSDRPSSGPRSRRVKKPGAKPSAEDKRPRTAFSGAQLARLKHEFAENRYLTERRRQQLSAELGLNEAQIKIWFQNKRAKIKKASGQKNPLALQLMAQGLYNHSTVPCDEDDMPMSS